MAADLFEQMWNKLHHNVMDSRDPTPFDKSYYSRQRIYGVVEDNLITSSIPNLSSVDYVWEIGNALYSLLELIFVESNCRRKRFTLIELAMKERSDEFFVNTQHIFLKFEACFPYDSDDHRLAMKVWHVICHFRRDYLNRAMIHKRKLKGPPPSVQDPKEKIRKIME